MISVEGLSVEFNATPLFEDVSYVINKKDRIALVGKNGAGKSTMLKILAGLQSPTRGVVATPKDVTIGYLPQVMILSDNRTVMGEAELAFEHIFELQAKLERMNQELAERTDYDSEEYHQLIDRFTHENDRFLMMGGTNFQAEIERTLLGLGFSREDFERPTSEFSGGWRMRIELAKLLLRRPDVLLLDEPTNHLDIESIQWLENFLSTRANAVVLVSHDRAFLNNVTTRTIEITCGQIYDYKVKYDEFVVLRKERREQQLRAYENQQKQIQDTEDFIERFRYKPTKSNQVQSRIKQLEKIERIEVDEEDLSRLNIKFPPAPRSGQIVVEAKDAGKSFGEKHVFSGATFTIERGQKIALVGRNGEGKTTFARMAIGQLEPTEGSVRIGHNVRIGYYAQNQDDLMNGDFTVFDTLDRVAVGDIRTRLRDILGAFLFRGEDIDKKVRVLSGGERARLAMARLMLEPYNLLVLDEPTNHMDMRSKDILKDAVRKYDGTVIVISHDREFLDGLVERVYEFRDGRVKEHLGGIYDFLRDRQIESMREIEQKAPVVTAEQKPKGPSGKAQYEQKREAEKQLRKAERDVEKAEQEIMALEKEIAEKDRQLADPAAHGIDLADGSFYAHYNELKDKLNKLTYRWEELSITLENLKETLAS